MQSIEAQGFAKKEKSTMVLIGNHRTFLAEMKGFEPLHGVTRLPHFECGPFNHLGTSPLLKYYAIEFPGFQEGTFPLHSP